MTTMIRGKFSISVEAIVEGADQPLKFELVDFLSMEIIEEIREIRDTDAIPDPFDISTWKKTRKTVTFRNE